MSKPVVTVAGEVGSGATELAQELARLLGANFVDRQVMATAAARLGVSVQMVEDKDRTKLPRGERFARLLETFLERSAVGDPTLGTSGVEVLMSRSYDEALAASQHPSLTNAKYLEVLRSVMADLAREGNVIILRRGGQVLLRGLPGVLHINVVAPYEDRLLRHMQFEGLDRAAAQKDLRDTGRDRLGYFRKFFKVNPESTEWYHLVINSHMLPPITGAQLVARAFADGIVF